jgi:protein involved in polysaccharide export with SLBB domain
MSCGKETAMHIRRTLDVLTTSILGALLFVFLYASGCGNPVAHIQEFPTRNLGGVKPVYGPSAERYRLVPYDLINVRYTYHPERDPKVALPIRPDGNITLEGIGSISAAGLTPEQLANIIAEKSSGRLKDPEVIVTIAQYAPRKIYVGGEVKAPGIVNLQEIMTPLQAIFDRGGFTTSAQVDSVILIRDAASGNPQIGRINVNQAMEKAIPEQITLLPNDVLYIPLSGIGRADLWVRQHLRDIIPWELIQPPGISSFIFK